MGNEIVTDVERGRNKRELYISKGLILFALLFILFSAFAPVSYSAMVNCTVSDWRNASWMASADSCNCGCEDVDYKLHITESNCSDKINLTLLDQVDLNITLIHGSVMGGNGYLYLSTQTNPGMIFRLNPDNLSDQISISLSRGMYDICWYNNKIYAVTVQDGAPSYKSHIAEIEADLSAYTYVFDFGKDLVSITADATNGWLYVGAMLDNNNIIRIDSNNWSSFEVINSTISGSVQSIEYDNFNNVVWASSINDVKLVKIVPPNDVTVAEYQPYTAPSDDLAFDSNYVYIVTEHSPKSEILRINKSNMSDFTVYNLTSDGIGWACFADNYGIWGVLSSGKLEVVDFAFTATRSIFDVLGSANEIVKDIYGAYYVTAYSNNPPSAVAKYTGCPTTDYGVICFDDFHTPIPEEPNQLAWFTSSCGPNSNNYTKWALLNTWEVPMSFKQIAANLSNISAMSYYNTTSHKWESYITTMKFNENRTIPINSSIFIYFRESTDVTLTEINSSAITIPANVSFYTYLRGLDPYTLGDIETSIEADGITVASLYAWNATAQAYTNASPYEFLPDEGFVIYSTTGGLWHETF